ncbi:uncharacterized protein LOC116129497 [Pistacia vera]|uniref:uncharacterized protein LOC116129497 n=1 Tax=Pistacia vera TaxID=55513 RepID=UPI0012634603|nr:uncharacterized protein LOC116129497 [Pistacia vera]
MRSRMMTLKRRRRGHRYGKIHMEVDILPLDLIYDILSRLPIESIMRCISKNKLDPVIICNPVTKECLILPLLGLEENFLGHQIGFGVDPLSGQYKVVRAYRTNNKYFISGFQIITLGESSWRQLKRPGIALEGDWDSVVCWNGALHWIIKDRNRKSHKVILAFSLEDEGFYTISFLIRQRVRGTFNFKEHEVHLMNIWEISGSRLEGFSVSFKRTYDSSMQWNKYLNYVSILNSELKIFLLLVHCTNQEGMKRSWFVRFFIEIAQYSHQDITGLPDQFGIIHFNPSLVSPIAASLVSKSASSLKELLRLVSNEWRTWSGYAVLKPELLEQLRSESGN